jgi:hypothetical protein
MASWFAGLPPVAGARTAAGLPVDAVVSLRTADGGEASITLRQVQARQMSPQCRGGRRAVPAARPGD